eukprot:55309_1
MALSKQNLMTILVSGGNKGIGYAICKRILQRPDIRVILGSRSVERGEAAATELRSSAASGSSLEVIALDLDDASSITSAAEQVRAQWQSLDVLVNNAGIAFKGDAFDKTVVDATLKTNFYGTWEVTKAFLPLIPNGGRIVNVSSMMSRRSFRNMNPVIRDRFLNDRLTFPELCDLLDEFSNAVEDGTYSEKGWPKQAYGVSKCGVSMMTHILARDYPNLVVNCCCPGYVDTDMTSHRGHKTPDEGAMTPAHLAIGDLKGENGKFWEDLHTKPYY